MYPHCDGILSAFEKYFLDFVRSEGVNCPFELWESFEECFNGDVGKEWPCFSVPQVWRFGSLGEEPLIRCLVSSATFVELFCHGKPGDILHDLADHVELNDRNEGCSFEEGESGPCALGGDF